MHHDRAQTLPSDLHSIIDEAVVRELSEPFAEVRRALGWSGFREAVAHGIARARAHGLRDVAELSLYVTLAFRLGGRFDTDPTLPWAKELLRAPGTPRERLLALVPVAMEHVEQVAGPGGEYFRRAMGRYLELAPADFEHFEPTLDNLWALAQVVYPERAATLDELAFEDLCITAACSAVEHDLPRRAGTVMLLLLQLLLGTHVLRDPRYPWAALAMQRGSAPLPWLHEAARCWMEPTARAA